MRTPTENQYRRLLLIANGNAGLSWGQREAGPLLRHEWVTAQRAESEHYWHWVRITPAGLRALALAVERYGLPDLGPRPTVERRVCAECGGTTWRFEHRPASEVAA